MSKQYYCDYCLRSFRNTTIDRKKHRQSYQHRKAKFDYNFLILIRLSTKFNPQQLKEILSQKDYHKLKRLFELFDKRKDSRILPTIKIDSSETVEECLFRLLELISLARNNKIQKEWSFHLNESEFSRKQLRKELLLNVWLEERFDLDHQSDCFEKNLSQNQRLKQLNRIIIDQTRIIKKRETNFFNINNV